ncbi:hypothetical protein J4481_00470 [Candidatus Pacearchaeota archaeon]|nr:hypothetical protein [Candidatus Pacearchaeota archaeon]
MEFNYFFLKKVLIVCILVFVSLGFFVIAQEVGESCDVLGEVSLSENLFCDGTNWNELVGEGTCLNNYECVSGYCTEDGVCGSRIEISEDVGLIELIWGFFSGKECVPYEENCSGTKLLAVCNSLGFWETKDAYVDGSCGFEVNEGVCILPDGLPDFTWEDNENEFFCIEDIAQGEDVYEELMQCDMDYFVKQEEGNDKYNESYVGCSEDELLPLVYDCVLSLDIYDVIESNMQSCLDGTYNASSGSGTDSVCGNDIIESGEACEGINLDDKTCLTEGFTSGTLACSNDCSFDYSTCVSPIKPNITYSNFDGDTTDFDSLTNFNDVNVVLENSLYGKVVFLKPINLTRNLNLNKNVKFSQNNIFINSTRLTEFKNVPAHILLYNISLTTPRVLKDGVVCSSPACQVLKFSNKTLNFSVTSFSAYSSQETPVTTSGGSSGGGGGGSSSGGSSLFNYTNEDFCGDFVCEAGESCSSCAQDCGSCFSGGGSNVYASECGDAFCDIDETSDTCPEDCEARKASPSWGWLILIIVVLVCGIGLVLFLIISKMRERSEEEDEDEDGSDGVVSIPKSPPVMPSTGSSPMLKSNSFMSNPVSGPVPSNSPNSSQPKKY